PTPERTPPTRVVRAARRHNPPCNAMGRKTAATIRTPYADRPASASVHERVLVPTILPSTRRASAAAPPRGGGGAGEVTRSGVPLQGHAWETMHVLVDHATLEVDSDHGTGDCPRSCTNGSITVVTRSPTT